MANTKKKLTKKTRLGQELISSLLEILFPWPTYSWRKRSRKKEKALNIYKHRAAIISLIDLVEHNCDDLMTQDEEEALAFLKDALETM